MSKEKSYEKYMETIVKCPLFKDIPSERIGEMLEFLDAFTKTYKKGEMVLGMGEPFNYAGIVLSGKVQVSYTNNQFDKLNINQFLPSNIFGEAIALNKISYSPIEIEAIADSVILFIDLANVVTSNERCCAACSFNHQLLLNLIKRMSTQNIFSNLKLRILSQKSLRDKIFIYLFSLQPDKNNIRKIPFTQTALAEFLCANRSALSRELGRMQDEGLIELQGNQCKIKIRDY